MKKKDRAFSEKYDLLFEKPKRRVLEDKKVRILLLIGVIVTGVAISSPFLATMVVLPISERILNKSQEELDKIEASQLFVEVPIFKENLTIQFPPDYESVDSYKMTFDGKNLNFGNGYTLEISDSNSIENKLSEYKLKPTEGYDTVNNILMVKNTINQFQIIAEGNKHRYDRNDAYEKEVYTAVRVTGNLLESVDMQKMKEKDSFLTLLQQPNIGDVKTGIVVNSSPAHGTSDGNGKDIIQSYVVLTKYWLFPDGIGVLVDVNDVYLGNLGEQGDFGTLTDSKLNEIDQFTNNTYSWLTDHFKMSMAPN